MSNIIERLTGTSTIEGDKIAIHGFCGAFNEYRRGKLTGQEIIAMFTLTTAQVDQVLTLVGLLNAAPEKTEFMRVFKDLLYMGEIGLGGDYVSIAFYNTRLQAEVTDQGGTLP